jgi:hypothetical protein
MYRALRLVALFVLSAYCIVSVASEAPEIEPPVTIEPPVAEICFSCAPGSISCTPAETTIFSRARPGLFKSTCGRHHIWILTCRIDNFLCSMAFSSVYHLMIFSFCAAANCSTINNETACHPGHCLSTHNCTLCSKGQYSLRWNGTQCDSCVPGTFSPVGASRCTTCARGYICLFNAVTNATIMRLCPPGTSLKTHFFNFPTLSH